MSSGIQQDTILLLRTNRFDETIWTKVSSMNATSRFSICVLADEKTGTLDLPDGVAKLTVSREIYADLGLYSPDDVLWRCGDYCLYRARQKYPEAEAFWMIEPDVTMNSDQPDELLSHISMLDTDFVCGYLGPADPGWGWYASMKGEHETVFKCLFPFTRFSSRAVDHLFQRRLELSREYQLAPAGSITWPNDEAFCATELCSGGFACHDLNSFGKQWYTRRSLRTAMPHSEGWLASRAKDGLIYHPVLSADHFSNKLKAKFRSDRREGKDRAHFMTEYGPDVIEQLKIERDDLESSSFAVEVSLAIDVASTPVGAPVRKSASHAADVVCFDQAEKRVSFVLPRGEDLISDVIRRGCFYEDVELAKLATLFQAGTTFVDIGAHLGNHSVFVGSYLDPGAIISIEPNPNLCMFLEINVRSNSRCPVSVVKDAVGHGRGRGVLQWKKRNTGSAVLKSEVSFTGSEDSAHVSIVSLDEICIADGPVFLKIDVGDSDLSSILIGATKILQLPGTQLLIHVPEPQSAAVKANLEVYGFRDTWSFRRYGGSSMVAYSR